MTNNRWAEKKGAGFQYVFHFSLTAFVALGKVCVDGGGGEKFAPSVFSPPCP